MSKNGIQLILFVSGICILACAASALSPGDLSWQITDNGNADGWLTAGGTETAAITVEVGGTTVISASISTDGNLGTFTVPVVSSPYIQTTFTPGTKSGNSPVYLTITHNNGSGPITETFSSPAEIKIDHNTPWETASVDYPGDLEVNSVASIAIRMVDRYGNPVDSRYEDDVGGSAEAVNFACTPKTACFLDTFGVCTGQSVVARVDASGAATTGFRLSPIAGENVIYIDPVPTRPLNQWITIYGEGLSYPSSMDINVYPATLEVPIGGSTFTITYSLFDQYGNPAPDSNLTLTTDLGGTQYYKTNEKGQVTIQYGPKGTVGSSTITATTDNPGVTDETIVWFVWPKGLIMQFAAIPQTMPSRDVDINIQSELVVTLTGGNVSGRTVTFNLADPVIDNGTLSSLPYLTYKDGTVAGLSGTVKTNSFGEAIMYYVPGEFDAGPVSKATSAITATWNGTVQTVTVEFRNDPYISVETKIFPDKDAFAPGETIFIEIWLKGDGIPILVTKPIDALLVMNRGDSTFGDMYWSGTSYTEDKLVWAVYGAMGFAKNIQSFMSGENQLGLITYGPVNETVYPSKLPGTDNTATDDIAYIEDFVLNPGWDAGYNFNDGHYPGFPRTYTDYAQNDLLLDNYTHEFQDALRNTTPSSTSGGTDLCPMRYALYESIKELTSERANSAPDTVRAIVLLTDRQWDSGGDILAGGSWDDTTKTWTTQVMPNQANTAYDEEDNWPQSGFGAWAEFHYEPLGLINSSSPEQNMAILAKKNGIRIFVLAYPNKANNIPTSIEAALQALADSTGGKYYIATTGQGVYDDFQKIADELKIAASLNTTMSVDFIQSPDSDPITYTADEIFNYTSYIPFTMPVSDLNNESTAIRHWNWNESFPLNSKNIFPSSLNGVKKNYAFDQTSDWEDDQILTFGIDKLGTLNIGETWMTRFGFEINSSINDTLIFDLFGPNSGIFMEYGATKLPIYFPPTVLMVDPGLIPDPLIDTRIDISNLIETGITIEKVSFEWDLDYNGTDTFLTEIIEVRDPWSGGWNTIGVKEIANSTTHDTYNWFIMDQPLGEYTLRVTYSSADAGFDREDILVDTTVLQTSPYIKVV